MFFAFHKINLSCICCARNLFDVECSTVHDRKGAVWYYSNLNDLQAVCQGNWSESIHLYYSVNDTIFVQNILFLLHFFLSRIFKPCSHYANCQSTQVAFICNF